MKLINSNLVESLSHTMNGYIRSRNITINELIIKLYVYGGNITIPKNNIHLKSFIPREGKIYVGGYYDIELKEKTFIMAEKFTCAPFQLYRPLNVICTTEIITRSFNINLFHYFSAAANPNPVNALH